MRKYILHAMVLALIASGCSTYKAGVTPDDVYYSQAKPAREYASRDKYEDYSNGDDNYLRMKVHSRYRWNAIDDYDYWNDSRYDFGYGCFPSRSVLLNPYYGYSVFNPYNPYYIYPWASWYNPMYTIVYYKAPRVFYGNTSKTNLTAYRNYQYYNPQRNTFGSLIKNAFSGNNNNYNTNTNLGNNPTRSFSTGSSTSNNAGGRSGGFNSTGSSTSTPRPPRGNH